MKKITAVQRPYLLTFVSTGSVYPLSSDAVQELLDEYPAIRANSQRVVLRGNGLDYTTVIQPATRGGGPAFLFD